MRRSTTTPGSMAPSSSLRPGLTARAAGPAAPGLSGRTAAPSRRRLPRPRRVTARSSSSSTTSRSSKGQDLAPELAADLRHQRDLVPGVVEDQLADRRHRPVPLLPDDDEALLPILRDVD